MIRVLCAVAKSDFLHQLRYPLSLFFNVIAPVFLLIPLLLVVRVFGASDYYLWVVIGTLAWAWLSQIVWSVGLGLRNEQRRGTMEQIAMTPTSLLRVMVGKSIFPLIINLILLLISGVFITFVFNVQVNWLLVLITFICMMPFMYGLAFMLAGMVLNFGEVFALFQMVILLFALICGVTQPVNQLPRLFSIIGNSIPITWGIQLSRDIIINQYNWGDSIQTLTCILSVGVIFNFTSVLFLRRLEKRAQRDGRGLYGY